MGGSALAFLHRLGVARNCMENIDDPDSYSYFILLRRWIVVCHWGLGDHCGARVGICDTIPYPHQSIHEPIQIGCSSATSIFILVRHAT